MRADQRRLAAAAARRLPTLMTGRASRRRQSGAAEPAAARGPPTALKAAGECQHGPAGSAWAPVTRGRAHGGGRGSRRDHGRASAPWRRGCFHERPRRGAELARRTGSPTSATSIARARRRRHLHGRAAGEELSAISAKFDMCGPKTMGLPKMAGSRMLWPPIDEAAADEHDGRDLVDPRQLANRVEHDDVGARTRRPRPARIAADARNPSPRASA